MTSSIVITSIDQLINGVKSFTDIRVQEPTQDTQACSKKCVDSEIAKVPIVDSSQFVQKVGDTMSGPLIVPKDNYPVQGSLNEVISYETQREIFLSKREGGRMEQVIGMNNHHITNCFRSWGKQGLC